MERVACAFGAVAGLVMSTAAMGRQAVLYILDEPSEFHAVSGDGSTAVGRIQFVPGSAWEASMWTVATGGVSLGVFSEYSSDASDVSADGSVIVGWTYGGPFYWTPLGTSSVPMGSAGAVSADGAVVLGRDAPDQDDDITRLWTVGGSVELLGEWNPRAMSADGRVILGGMSLQPGGASLRWTAEGGAEPIMPLQGYSFTQVDAVNHDGSVIVGASFIAMESVATVWNERVGTFGLGDLPGGLDFSFAKAVSADGSVVIGIGSVDGASGSDKKQAFVWTPSGGLRQLSDVVSEQGIVTDFRFNCAEDISADGSVIVGWGSWSGVSGRHAFVLSLPDLAMPPCADANGDTTTDLADLQCVLNAWGTNDPASDFTRDGFVGIEDLQLLLFNFGLSCE